MACAENDMRNSKHMVDLFVYVNRRLRPTTDNNGGDTWVINEKAIRNCQTRSQCYQNKLHVAHRSVCVSLMYGSCVRLKSTRVNTVGTHPHTSTPSQTKPIFPPYSNIINIYLSHRLQSRLNWRQLNFGLFGAPNDRSYCERQAVSVHLLSVVAHTLCTCFHSIPKNPNKSQCSHPPQ